MAVVIWVFTCCVPFSKMIYLDYTCYFWITAATIWLFLLYLSLCVIGLVIYLFRLLNFMKYVHISMLLIICWVIAYNLGRYVIVRDKLNIGMKEHVLWVKVWCLLQGNLNLNPSSIRIHIKRFQVITSNTRTKLNILKMCNTILWWTCGVVICRVKIPSTFEIILQIGQSTNMISLTQFGWYQVANRFSLYTPCVTQLLKYTTMYI